MLSDASNGQQQDKCVAAQSNKDLWELDMVGGLPSHHATIKYCTLRRFCVNVHVIYAVHLLKFMQQNFTCI